MKLLYLHGFNSSPESTKAKIFSKFLSKNIKAKVLIPNLPNSPKDTIELLSNIVEKENSKISIIGSSMGGLYSSFISEKYKIKSVVINPVVPNHLKKMESIIGEHINFHTKEKNFFSRSDYNELFACSISKLTNPLNHLCLVQLGDEVLDHTLTLEYFKNSFALIESGGNHQFDSFERYLPLILDFMMN